MLLVSDFHTINPQADKLAPKRPEVALPTVEEEAMLASATEPDPQDQAKDSHPLDETCTAVPRDSAPLDPPTSSIHFEH